MAFNAHTEPAVNIPSKKIPIDQCTLRTGLVTPPKTMDIKKPTHVDVHKVQVIKSPKNLECFLMKFLVDSNILPQTSMEVIPYAVIIHKNKISIMINFTRI